MMELEILLRWSHVLGACVLLGTGSGIAFFMLMAHRSQQPVIIAHTAAVVVLADAIFTATAVVWQPVSGILLAHVTGWPLTTGWIVCSLSLYMLIGALWLPVVWIQVQMRNLARAAVATQTAMPPRYQKLFVIWFLCGIPAFSSVLLIVWLMLARPEIDLSVFNI